MDKIFSLDNFNTYHDNNYYYFFRALNNDDNKDINNNITTDEMGNIIRIRTNRERYEGIAKYQEDENISLEQITDHIKIHQNKETNCISLTSNANTALLYGRGNYNDKYVIIKVPKEDINKKVYQAGLYMLKEINKRISAIYNNLPEEKKILIDTIENTKTLEELENLKIEKKKESYFEEGLTFNITDFKNFVSLNEEQNLIKNKTVMKLDILEDNLIPKISNKFLMQTVGGAFSSLELIHYNEIKKHEIISIKKEAMDILSLIQQVPQDMKYIDELKELILKKLENLNIQDFNYKDFSKNEDELSLDNLYYLTGGIIDYKTACNLYKKAFYFCKSKIRKNNSYLLLKQIINDDPKYKEILDYINNNTFGIEPEIISKESDNIFNLSESIGFNFNQKEMDFLNMLNKLDMEECLNILNNPKESIKFIINRFIDHKDIHTYMTKEEWYANSLIDKLNFKRLGVKENLSIYQRNDIINCLIENNFYHKYLKLKEKNISETKIANILFTSIIRNNNKVSLKNLFTLEELENFIGYNKIKDTRLNLKPYQRIAVDNIDHLLEDKNFAAAILPTGAGKSFIALAEMYKRKNEKMLYLAPNEHILNQVKLYIRNLYRPDEKIGDKLDDVVKNIFPNCIFDTYQHLMEASADDIIKNKYSLIIFDELHRTGAKEWIKYIQNLIDNQNENTKVLGITATPERDSDYKVMTNFWAKKLGYTDEEINLNKHLAINMDIIDAIEAGYIVHPKVICCEYSLISDGTYDDLKLSIDNLKQANLDNNIIKKYEQSRKDIEKADGIEKILSDNLNSDGKYIVFLPVNRKDNGTYEDEDGNIIDKTTAEQIIKDYQTLIKQYLFSNDYFNKNKEIIYNIHNKLMNNISLSFDENNFLNKEKENILLLSLIDIKQKPNALNTKNGKIIENIIKKYNWQKYDKKLITSKLNKLMGNKINNYSMLGSYSSNKNNNNLASFNNDKSNKIKLMFVMNKLNEGVHVEKINGIIWLRALDENSKILYLQQLGRSIYSLDENIEFNDKDRPIVLDLVNNTLKIDLNKGTDNLDRDLVNITYIEEWIKNNNKYPDINCTNEREKTFAKKLNTINKKYSKYLNENDTLESLNLERKEKIKAILKIGANIDLWSKEIYIIENQSDYKRNSYNNLLDYLEINSVEKDFLELKNDINEKMENLNIITYVKELILYCDQFKEWPKKHCNNRAKDSTKSSQQLYDWLYNSGYINGNFKYNHITYNNLPIISFIDNLANKYKEFTKGSEEAIINWVKELILYCNYFNEWPKNNNSKIAEGGTKTSNQLFVWLNNSGYINGEFKYNYITYNNKPIKSIIDNLANKYKKFTKGSEEAIINWIKELELYCNYFNEWPKQNDNKKAKNGIKTSNQLYRWLHTSGYNKREFKYNHITYNDKPIKSIIDDLANKYKKFIQGSEEAIINWIKELELYCNYFNEWPKNNNKIAEGGIKTSNQLFVWLNDTSGYIKGKFKYNHITYNDKPIKSIIDNLYNKYNINIKNYKKAKEEFNELSKFNEQINKSNNKEYK